MNKIYNFMTKIGITKYQDKILHFIVGLIIMLIGFQIIGIYALGLVLLIAVAKEVYDRKTTGFNYYDIAATLLGGWVGLVIYSYINN